MTLNRELKNSPAYFDLSNLQFMVGERVITPNGIGVVKGFEFWEEGNVKGVEVGIHYNVLIVETPLRFWLYETEYFRASEMMLESKFTELLWWVTYSKSNCPPTIPQSSPLSPSYSR